MPRKEYIAWFDVPMSGKLHGQSVRPRQELIRCKECERYVIDILKSDGTADKRYRPTWCRFWKEDMNPDDYCSYAMRKVEEGLE